MIKQINVTCEKCKESFVFSAESSVVDKVLDEGHYICFTCEDKLELQNIKYREEIARMQKSLRKKNKSIKDLNESVKNIKSERDEWKVDANQLDKEKDEFIIENEKLKSQLQQQALPVVPECVAEWYESYGKSSESLEFYIYLFCGEFYSSRDSRKNRELTNFEKWFGEDKNKPIETLIRMQDGYTVEKQQLFKLIFPNSTAVLQKDGELNSFADTVYKRYLMENAMTEQEIKSIDERYWQFAVPVEDGE